MGDFQIVNGASDWQRYMAVFNRHMRFAPYTLPLSADLLDRHCFKDVGQQLCLIGKNARGEGIIHVGRFQNDSLDNGQAIGLVYLLLGDNNNVTENLLREAESWFMQKGLNLIRACNWRPNPYKYILHGSETYVWGGSVETLNAYRRLNYDLQAESVIMICKMDSEPTVPIPDIPELRFTDDRQLDHELVFQSRIRAWVGEKEVGHCTYEHLRAISAHFGKPMGQIAIGIDEERYGQGLGSALLLSAHRALYRLGVRQVMLHTVQGLFRAIRLYEKTGYEHQVIRGYCFEKELNRDG